MQHGSRRCLPAFRIDGDGAQLFLRSIRVANANTGEVIQDLPRARTVALAFSPDGSQLASWEAYQVKKGETEGRPNVSIWSLETGTEVASWINRRIEGWSVPTWERSGGG